MKPIVFTRHAKLWSGTVYAVKQVVPLVAEETDRLVVITVYTFYF